MGLSVLDVISHRAFQGAVIAGGWTGLKQRVTGVTVAEVPDSAQWLAGGELVLSTAYIVRDDPAGFVDWLRSLVEHGAAALAIKPQRFLGTLPDEVMREADRIGFPLISLPYAVNWPNLIKPVTASLLLNGQGLHPATHTDELADLLLQRAGFTSTCQRLATLFDCAAVISDMEGRVLGVGIAPGQLARLGPVVARFAHDRQGLAYWQTSPHQTEAGHWSDRKLDDGTAVRTYPLQVADHLHGTLSVLVPAWPMPDVQQTAVDLWAGAIALSYQRLAAYHEAPANQRSAALRALLLGEGHGVPTADRSLTEALSEPGFAAIISLDGADTLAALALRSRPGGELDATGELMLLLERWLADWDALAALTVLDGRPVIIAHAHDSNSWATSLHEMLVQRSSTGRVLVAVGGAASDLVGYRRSVGQAQGTLRLALLQGLSNGVHIYDRLGIDRLLASVGDLSGVRCFARELLRPLLEADSSLDLVPTATAYLRCDAKITATAEALFVHPNTVRYRLKRIEALTGLNLQAIDDQAQLWAALKIHDLGEG